MPQSLQFILLTLVLAAGVFSGTSIARLPAVSPLWWLLPVFFLSIGLSRFLKQFSSYYLFLALPLAALIASAAGNRVWAPPHSYPQEKPPVAAGLVPIPVHSADDRVEKQLYAPPGTQISIFARHLNKPRMLRFNHSGVLFASQPQTGQILAFPDRNADGAADEVVVFAAGLDRPHGLDFWQGNLYVAETGRILKLVDADADLHADQVEVISEDLPSGGGHWTRTLLADNAGHLYVSSGSSCNSCLEEDPRRATVMKFSAAGGAGHIFAYGLRNSVGLSLSADGHQIWASENGRDQLGDDLPPDEINLLVEGGDYGWPYCFGQRVADPNRGGTNRCRQTLPAVVDIPAHSAPLGICFGDGLNADASIRKSLLVAYHGSWNRSIPTGYKLVSIPFRDGQPDGKPRDLIAGWLQDGRAWGRPVAPQVGPDGALYLSDDRAGYIYRIVFPRSSS